MGTGPADLLGRVRWGNVALLVTIVVAGALAFAAPRETAWEEPVGGGGLALPDGPAPLAPAAPRTAPRSERVPRRARRRAGTRRRTGRRPARRAGERRRKAPRLESPSPGVVQPGPPSPQWQPGPPPRPWRPPSGPTPEQLEFAPLG